MAFPNLYDFTSEIAILLVGVVVVYLLSRALKLHPKPITIEGLKKETIAVFIVIAALFVARFALDTLGYLVVLPTFTLYKLPPYPPFAAADVLWGVLMQAVFLLLMILAMKRTGQSLGSIGVTGVDKWRNLALGLVLSAIYVAATGLLGGGTFAGFSISLVYVFIVMVIVGFIQEIVWRGYVQTRLTARVGTVKGLVVTALLFGLWHFPTRYFQYGVASEALADIFVGLLPISLLLGYVMLRSRNIIPASILHLFVNVSSFLWQLPT